MWERGGNMFYITREPNYDQDDWSLIWNADGYEYVTVTRGETLKDAIYNLYRASDSNPFDSTPYFIVFEDDKLIGTLERGGSGPIFKERK